MKKSPRLESFLARICSDAGARDAFLADPVGEATRYGLDPAEVASVSAVDREALDLEARRLQRDQAGESGFPGAPAPAASGVRRLLIGFLMLATVAAIAVLWVAVLRGLGGVGLPAPP